MKKQILITTNFFGSDICFICKELNEIPKDMIKFGRCSRHENWHFCNFCRRISIGNNICLQCRIGIK